MFIFLLLLPRTYINNYTLYHVLQQQQQRKNVENELSILAAKNATFLYC